MNHEFKLLVPILNAYRNDVANNIKEILIPFKEILPHMEIVVGIILECPKGCSGKIGISSGMRGPTKLLCPVCGERIDAIKWRTKSF